MSSFLSQNERHDRAINLQKKFFFVKNLKNYDFSYPKSFNNEKNLSANYSIVSFSTYINFRINNKL